jgi:hypothetical protein
MKLLGVPSVHDMTFEPRRAAVVGHLGPKQRYWPRYFRRLAVGRLPESSSARQFVGALPLTTTAENSQHDQL